MAEIGKESSAETQINSSALEPDKDEKIKASILEFHGNLPAVSFCCKSARPHNCVCCEVICILQFLKFAGQQRDSG